MGTSPVTEDIPRETLERFKKEIPSDVILYEILPFYSVVIDKNYLEKVNKDFLQSRGVKTFEEPKDLYFLSIFYGRMVKRGEIQFLFPNIIFKYAPNLRFHSKEDILIFDLDFEILRKLPNKIRNIVFGKVKIIETDQWVTDQTRNTLLSIFDTTQKMLVWKFVKNIADFKGIDSLKIDFVEDIDMYFNSDRNLAPKMKGEKLSLYMNWTPVIRGIVTHPRVRGHKVFPKSLKSIDLVLYYALLSEFNERLFVALKSYNGLENFTIMSEKLNAKIITYLSKIVLNSLDSGLYYKSFVVKDGFHNKLKIEISKTKKTEFFVKIL